MGFKPRLMEAECSCDRIGINVFVQNSTTQKVVMEPTKRFVHRRFDFLKPWLHVKYSNFEIIWKLFQCCISHVTTSETEIKLFQQLKLFQNYFSDIEHVGNYS